MRTAGTEDEGYYNNLPIEFTFKFADTSYHHAIGFDHWLPNLKADPNQRRAHQ